jgi:hypothetical protein
MGFGGTYIDVSSRRQLWLVSEVSDCMWHFGDSSQMELNRTKEVER